MPIYRGPDGKIIEERTKRIQDDEVTDLRQSNPTPASNVGANVGIGDDQGSEDLTKKVNIQSLGAESDLDIGVKANSSEDADKTRLFAAEKPAANVSSEKIATSQLIANPTVGWLAVVSGPGKGNVLSFGYGSNPIGRGGSARVNIDFGDAEISRGEHAIVTYDPRGKKFYIQHGSGNNLTYLEQEPVLVPTELSARAQITLGQTKLMFVPLCGDSFDWQDLKDDSSNEQT
jgi:hypothetical protein